MKQVPLGRTGVSVSRVGLGAMPLSIQGRPDQGVARRVVQRAVELGVTFIDTADVYCLDHTEIGHNERLVGEALREMGVGFGGLVGQAPPGGNTAGSGGRTPGGSATKGVVVATKGGMIRPDGRWERNGRPEHIRRACEASLRALGVECIDLYQFHAPDPEVPFVESVGAFVRLHEEGKVASVGLSNVDIPQLRQALELVPITSVQNRFGPWDVSFRPSPIIEFCREQGITFLPYSPLGGRNRAGVVGEVPGLRELADRMGASSHELVLAWILRRGPHVVPIPGASRNESIESSVRAAGLELGEDMDREIRRAFGALPGVQGVMSRVVGRIRRMVGGGG